jgi:hypothetical protein
MGTIVDAADNGIAMFSSGAFINHCFCQTHMPTPCHYRP